MTDSSPGLLQDKMQELEDELQLMLNPWSGAEEAFIRTTAAVERLKATRRLWQKHNPPVGITKLTIEDLDALVLEWLWTEHEKLMVSQLDAEALCAAYRTKDRVAGKTLSSKQTRLNADIKLNLGTK